MLFPETQLGAEAAGDCGFRQVFPSLPFPPSLSLLSSFFAPFFFLEGQVLTFHCLLATASTSLSNRSAGYGPRQDEREKKEAVAESTAVRRMLLKGHGEEGAGVSTGQGRGRGRGAGRKRGQRAQWKLRWRRGGLRASDPEGKVERAWNGESDLVEKMGWGA